MAKQEKKRGALARIAQAGGWGALVSGGAPVGQALGVLGVKHWGPIGAIGGAAAGQALSDAISDPADSYLGEYGNGAKGGSILGGAAGAVSAGKHPGGMRLISHLMQKGMSKKAALALVLGGGVVGGAAAGALGGGANSALASWMRSEHEKKGR